MDQENQTKKLSEFSNKENFLLFFSVYSIALFSLGIVIKICFSSTLEKKEGIIIAVLGIFLTILVLFSVKMLFKYLVKHIEERIKH